jgi:myo-inositol-1(or 4)-monophosphatase
LIGIALEEDLVELTLFFGKAISLLRPRLVARVTEVDDPGRALLATGFPFKSGKGELDAYMLMVADAVRGTRDVRRAGSAALDLAFVAAGRVEGFFEMGLAPWDVAAGMLLVQEAGGRVTGWPGDADPPLHTGRVLASNGRIHEWMESLAAKHLPRLGSSAEEQGSRRAAERQRSSG